MLPRSQWNHLTKTSWHQPSSIRGYPLPTGGQFAPSKQELDPHIFDHDKMRPYIRETLITILSGFWTPRYGPGWQNWTRIYLAGSLASYWHATLDFDILVGVHTPVFVAEHPEFFGLSDEEVCNHLTQEFYIGLDPLVENFSFPPAANMMLIGESLQIPKADIDRLYTIAFQEVFGPMEMTWYVNSSSWDIRDIRPYAAYEVLDDKWYVHPSHYDKLWGAKAIPWDFWEAQADLADKIKEALSRDDATERREDAQAIYNYLHSERNKAFAPGGGGVMDYRSLQWITQNRWGLLGALEKEIHPERPVAHMAPAIAVKSLS